ncbi:hypothetical protein NLI96_g11359 [Meripilus lineatus]|uniref:Uncharacterized protein n=1 Tax=Meripilus lineatus TaxID=2056292 RepID=A0AAD5URX3_9APHY|nr:hypothetical protein NLI96_g11359 [Physisporinus lineatus]
MSIRTVIVFLQILALASFCFALPISRNATRGPLHHRSILDEQELSPRFMGFDLGNLFFGTSGTGAYKGANSPRPRY